VATLIYLALVAETGNTLPPLWITHLVFVGAMVGPADGASLTFTYITPSPNAAAAGRLYALTNMLSERAKKIAPHSGFI
jgi:hypothetical protein